MLKIDYKPPPTVQRYMLSDAPVNVIMGPVGSAKSTGSVMNILRRCCMMPPSNRDGLRHSRWVIVRNTYRMLKDTTIKTFLEWVPDGALGRYKSSDNVFELRFNDISADILFRPLDGPQDIRNLLSLELTGAWLNECREIHPDVVTPLRERIGRYPKQQSIDIKDYYLPPTEIATLDQPLSRGQPYWKGLIADTNPPNVGSWWYYMMEGLDPEDPDHPAMETGWEVFKQPSGRSPEAENIENLPEGYYDTTGKSKNHIRVYIDGQYGVHLGGFPVYENSFDYDFHVAKDELKPVYSTNQPLLIGMDFGRTPAAIFGQVDVVGRLLVFDEITSQNMGIETFCRDLLMPKLSQLPWKGMPVIVICDPAGMQKSQLNEESVIDVMRRLGFHHIQPAYSNDPEKRQMALEKLFLQQIGGKPMVILDKKAKTLVDGLSFGYTYAKTREGEIRTTGKRPSVVKNKYSHPCEAFEYMVMHSGMVGGSLLKGEKNYTSKAPKHRWFV